MQNRENMQVSADSIFASVSHFAWNKKIFVVPITYIYHLLLQDYHLLNRLVAHGIASPEHIGQAMLELAEENIRENFVNYSTLPDLKAKEIIANKSDPTTAFLEGYKGLSDAVLEDKERFAAELLVAGRPSIITYLRMSRAWGIPVSASGLFDFLSIREINHNPAMLIHMGLANGQIDPQGKSIYVTAADKFVPGVVAAIVGAKTRSESR